MSTEYSTGLRGHKKFPTLANAAYVLERALRLQIVKSGAYMDLYSDNMTQPTHRLTVNKSGNVYTSHIEK